MDEHRVIEVVLTCLESISEEAIGAGKLNEQSAVQAIDVIRSFADKCHHGKEEDHLFAALTAKGMARRGGPVGQMLVEHEQGREFVRAMSGSIPEAAGGNPRALQIFTENARGYVQLLRAHIKKEDMVLFPMADRMLNEEEQQQLMQAFTSVESDHMGKGTHEKYIAIVASLAKQYGIESGHLPTGSSGCRH